MVTRRADQYTPPFPVELLSDLHAGVLPDAEARILWPLVRSDPEAQAVITALDAVVAQLGAVGRVDAEQAGSSPTHVIPTHVTRTHVTPTDVMPAHVAERLDRALALASTEDATHPEQDSPHTAEHSPQQQEFSSRRRQFLSRRAVPVIASLVSAAAAVAIVLVVVDKPAPPVIGAPTTPGDPLTLTQDSLDPSTVMSLLGRRTLGPLSDPQALAACLRANDIAAGVPVLGSATVALDGAPGVLLVIPGPTPVQLTALVVGNECATGNPATLARHNIG